MKIKSNYALFWSGIFLLLLDLSSLVIEHAKTCQQSNVGYAMFGGVLVLFIFSAIDSICGFGDLN